MQCIPQYNLTKALPTGWWATVPERGNKPIVLAVVPAALSFVEGQDDPVAIIVLISSRAQTPWNPFNNVLRSR